jgi:hypothetical protein
MGRSIQTFLEDFSGDAAPAPSVVEFRPRMVEKPAAPDPSELIRDAYARGLEEGEAKARQEAEAQIAAIAADYDRQLEAARQALGDDVGERLVRELTAGLEQLGERLANAVATVLVPVLGAALADKAVTSLIDEIRRLAVADAVVEVSGSEELVERIRRRLEASDQAESVVPSLRFRTSGQPEIRIAVGDEIVETRLGEWRARIEKALVDG